MLIILSALIGLLIGYKLSSINYKKKLLSPQKQPTVLEKANIPVIQDHTKTLNTQKDSLEKKSTLEDKIWYVSALEFVFKFNESLALNPDRRTIVQLINEGARNFLYVEHSVLLLWDKETSSLSVAGAAGLTKDFSQYPALKDEENISRLVMKRKEPLIINDLDEEPYFKNLNKEEYLKKSFISVPLIFKNEAIGVLHVCDKKFVNPFTTRDALLITSISRIGAIALENVKLYEQIQKDYLKTITALASAIDARDSYTMHHSKNVAKYAVAIAQDMQCKPSEIDLVKQASLLHDIGKIAIKDMILLKNDVLTPDEFEQIKIHPVKGESIVNILSFLGKAAILIRHHHERYDGSGYPDKIKGQNIELGARILSVADVFDAMTTDRPYRKAFSAEEALNELERNKGTQFDPKIVDCLRRIIQFKPSIVQ
jgi:putative nucleotidyltransferase with HDIG domain